MIRQARAKANLSHTADPHALSNPRQLGTRRDNNVSGHHDFDTRGLAMPTTIETASVVQQPKKTSMEGVRPIIFRDRHDAYTPFQPLSTVGIDVQDGEPATQRKPDKLQRPLTRCLCFVKLITSLCKRKTPDSRTCQLLVPSPALDVSSRSRIAQHETKDTDQATRVVSHLSRSLLQIILSLTMVS